MTPPFDRPPAAALPVPRLTRRLWFRASHAYGRGEWDAERNRDVFGAQTDRHEHRWTIDVTVTGDLDPVTGWVVDLGRLDEILEELRNRLEGRDLAEAVPEHFGEGGHQPSTEEVARWVWGVVVAALSPPTRLVRVRVAESESLWAECVAPEGRP